MGARRTYQWVSEVEEVCAEEAEEERQHVRNGLSPQIDMETDRHTYAHTNNNYHKLLTCDFLLVRHSGSAHSLSHWQN